MNVKKNTGKALSLSILSTFLCVCMLFGMTYAWFKVEIDSGNNTIKIGAFEAKVYYSTTYIAADANGWEDFQGANVFSDVTLIPGDEVVRYVKFENKCDYPVRFDLALPTGSTGSAAANNIDVYMSDNVSAALTVAGMTACGKLSDIEAAATASAPAGIITKVVDAKTGNTPGTAIVAVGVKLPEEYTGGATELSETFKLRVIATQWNKPHASVTVAAGNDSTTVVADNVTVRVPAADVETGDTLSLVVSNINETEGTYNCDIALKNGTQTVTNATAPITVEIDVGIGKTITSVKHNGVEVPGWTYTNGVISFTTDHFSPFSVTFEVIDNAIYVENSADLRNAFEEAPAGSKIVLLNDIDATGEMYSGDTRFNLWIKKNATIYGNGHTLTVKGRGIGIQGASENVDVTFKNLTVTNTGNADGRCIDTRGKIGTLTFDGCTLTTKQSSYTGYLQPLTIGGNQAAAATVVINNSTIEVNEAANKGYAITTFNPVNMTITDSTLKGWACLNIKGPDNSAGSKGSVINLSKCSLTSNNGTPGYTNSYCAIKFEDDNVTVNGEKLTVKINGADNTQSVVSFQKLNMTNSSNCVVTLLNSDFTLEGDYRFTSNVGEGSKLVLDGSICNVDPTAFGYEAVENNGVWTINSTANSNFVNASSVSVSSGSLPELITP